MAATVLECFSASGTDFAILHRESDLAHGQCDSDVDLVANRDARDIIARARAHLHRHDLHPVVVWPPTRDLGATSVFIVDRLAQDGAQLDILHSHLGLGHYGVKAQAILDSVEPGVRWHRAAPEDELLYLISKRFRKAQHDRLAKLLTESTRYPTDRLRHRAYELFSAPNAAVVTALLDGNQRPTDRLHSSRRWLMNAGRTLMRFVRPVGFWVAVEGTEAKAVADLIASRFARVLQVSRSGRTSGDMRNLVSEMRDISAVRWRPGLYCSWGELSATQRPDLVVNATRIEEQLLWEVVAAMEQRL